MTRLMSMAREKVDQYELYWQRTHKIDVRYENFHLQQITENDLSSVALRVIDRGRLGFSYGVFPDQSDLLAQAKGAAVFGEQAEFSFSESTSFPQVETHDEQTASLTSKDLVALCEEVKERIAAVRPDIALTIQCGAASRRLTVETGAGTHAEHAATSVSLSLFAPVKGAGSGVGKYQAAISPFTLPVEMVDEFLQWYSWSETASTPKTGRLPVILAPEASFLLVTPLCAGLSGNAIAKGTSPLCGRMGETILADSLTVYDDPLRAGDPASRPFDDEGIPGQQRALVERGLLRGYLLDLHSAAKLGEKSTGNGFKRVLFGGGSETTPNPQPGHVVIEPGRTPYAEMIAGLEEGVLLFSGMGFHSGNYPQGQFAVQGFGFHIVDGKVKGRLERTMVAGDIYQDMKHIRAVSCERREGAGSLVPYILVDSLQVAGRP